jgi:LPS sulfotransferase NodH
VMDRGEATMARPERRFVVLTVPRTGSNLLCSQLNQHPEITCHHELFNPERVIFAQGWSPQEPSLRDIHLRNARPVAFLERDWRATAGASCVGFKLNQNQSRPVLEMVLADAGVRKIILKRKNRVRCFVSEKIALSTGEWESYPWSEFGRTETNITVDSEELIEHVSRQNRYFAALEQDLAAARQSYIVCHYERLLQRDQQEAVLDHLDVPRLGAPALGLTRRMNPGPLTQLISNFDDVRRRLQHSELLCELLEC